MAECFWTNHLRQKELLCVPLNESGVGYSMGGHNGDSSLSVLIEAYYFVSRTVITPAAALAVAKECAGVNSDSRGYALGASHIDGIQFSDETAINPAVTLPTSRGLFATCNSSDRGYALGGHVGGNPMTEIDGIQFSDETAINPAATLSVARYWFDGVNSSDRGYALGGSSWKDDIDGIRFSDEAAINPAATLSVGRLEVCGVNSLTRGYALGGNAATSGEVGPYTDIIDGVEFASETAINPAATLSIGKTYAAGINSVANGYALGGGIDFTIYTADICGINFSTESAINPSSELSVSKYGQAGCQSGGVL